MTGRTSIRLATGVVLLAATLVVADTEIHRCLLNDGTVAFQETPCAESDNVAGAASNADDSRDTGNAPEDDFDFASPFDEPAEPVMPSAERTLPAAVSQNRAECEKTMRDAIDAIDLEMKENTYSREQGQAYLAELLVLTARLRACKEL